MDRVRIKIAHLEEQRWQDIRSARDDIERVAAKGPRPGDEELIKALFNFIVARMMIIDYDLEEV